jgi:hypothetical protein
MTDAVRRWSVRLVLLAGLVALGACIETIYTPEDTQLEPDAEADSETDMSESETGADEENDTEETEGSQTGE